MHVFSKFSLCRLPRVIYFVVFAVAFISLASSTLADELWQQIINANRANVARIHSFDFVCEFSEDQNEKWYFRIRQKDGMTRADVRVDSQGNGPRMIYAYNGERFQNFNAQLDVLSFSGTNRFPNQYGGFCPVLLPYLWVLGETDKTWSELKDPAVWFAAKPKKERGNRTDSSGRELVDFDVQTSSSIANSFAVSFLPSKSFFPMILRAEKEGKWLQIETEQIGEFDLGDGQMFYYPAVLTMSATEPDPTYRFKLSNVRINHQIPDQVFTLSHSIAKRVDDYDRNMKRYRNEGALVDPTGVPDVNPNRWLFLLVIGGLVVAMVLGLIWKMRK